ncbi:MAG: carbohydrate ABC transporter permease [Saccharofermentanales bacterium]
MNKPLISGQSGPAARMEVPGSKIPAVAGLFSLALVLFGLIGHHVDNTIGWEAIPLWLAWAAMAVGLILLAASVYFGNKQLHRRLMAKHFLPYLLIVPAITFLLIFVLYPMLNLVYLSMFQGNVMNATKRFMGLNNYKSILFIKKDFMVALTNTAVYTASMVVLLIFFAVLFALWMFPERKINHIAQTVFFTPHLIASVTIAFIFQWLMDENSYGLFNSVLNAFGLPQLRWLNSSSTAMGSIVFVNVWGSIGYYALIMLAALKSIPSDIYEAVAMDTNSRVKRFFYITLPMLSPQLFFILITITIGSFKVFDSINIMTAGGPGSSTEVLARYIYDYAFIRTNTLGIASAAGTVLMLILIVLTLIYFRVLGKKVFYQ